MRRVSLLLTVLLFVLPAAAQSRRRSALPVDWTQILLPYVGGTIPGVPSGLVTDYAMRNDGDHPLGIVAHADLACLAGICLPPVQYQTLLGAGHTQTTHGEGFRSGGILNVDARATESIRLAARLHDFYPNLPSRPFERGTTGPQVPIARQSDFRKSIHLPSLPADVHTVLRVYSLGDAPAVAVKLFRVDRDDRTACATETPLADFVMQLTPRRDYGPYAVDAAMGERDLAADLAVLGMAIPGTRLAIQVDSPTPIWAMALQLDPERYLVTFASPCPAEEATLAAAQAANARILLPYLGAPLFDEGGLRSELVVHNASDRAVAFRFDPCAGTTECAPADPLPSTLPARMSYVPSQFSPSAVSRGGIFTVAAADEDALEFSLRLRAPTAPQSDFAVEGPEVPVARERDFRQSLHIISVPNHLETSMLDTSVRVFSLDGAPAVKVGMYSVEFGKETLLESFTLDLSQPDIDLPGFAERDLTTDLVKFNNEIPQSSIAFRIESPTPVWAMVIQRDPARHVIAFVTQQ